MKSIISVVVFLCLVTSCARGPKEGENQSLSKLDEIKEAGVLRVAVKEDAAPFGFKLSDDVYAGFEIDIIAAVARELGIDNIEFMAVNSSERIPVLKAGRVDLVIANMTITRTREADVDFSLPYFKDGQLLLTTKDSGINSYLDLEGKSVACIQASTGASNLSIVAPAAKRMVFSSNKEMVEALLAGKVDAITTDGVVLEGLRNANPDAGFVIVGNHFSEEPLAIAVPENQSDFRDAVNEALQQIWETGEWNSIYDAWFGEANGYQYVNEFHMQTYSH